MNRVFTITMAFALAFVSCNKSDSLVVLSPSGKVSITFLINGKGQPSYSLLFDQKTIVKPSTLGFEFKDMPPLSDNIKVDSFKPDHLVRNGKCPGAISDEYIIPTKSLRFSYRSENRLTVILLLPLGLLTMV